MNISSIFDSIINWEMEAGEDFMDYFDSNVNETNFMFWCLGRGYIDKERFTRWEDAFTNDKYPHSLSEFLYGWSEGEDNGFCIINSDEYEDDKQSEAYMILAEFIASSNTYKRRFNEFMENN